MEKILLTTRIRNGDRKAFDELCGRYYAMLVSYARLFMKDDWAEDVVQDVFYNVWQNRAALDDSNSLYKYLLRSVYNRALNYLDKNRRAGDYRQGAAAVAARPAVHAIGKNLPYRVGIFSGVPVCYYAST